MLVAPVRIDLTGESSSELCANRIHAVIVVSLGYPAHAGFSYFQRHMIKSDEYNFYEIRHTNK